MPVPSTFKAAFLPGKGGPPSISERSLPSLGSGEVAIKITATAINPVDWKMNDWNLFVKDWPAVLGSDAAGEIAAVGPDTSRFAVGDRVFFQGIIGNTDSSTFQQYCKMPEALVAKTPSSISDDEAAGVSLTTVCVVTAFYDVSGHGLPPPWDKEKGGDRAGAGKAIIIIGGSSSVGQNAIQLARLSGFERIITNSSPAHHDFLRELGAHVVLDRSKATPEAFAEAVGDLPLEFVLDAISSPETQSQGVEVLRASKVKDSHVITVMPPDAKAKELGEAAEPKVVVRDVLGLGSNPKLRYLSEPLVKVLGGEDGWLAKGLYRPSRPEVVPGGLAKLQDALEKNKAGVSGQKVIIRPQE